MGWIQNVSLAEIVSGSHKDPGPNSAVIQIFDPDYIGKTAPKFPFKYQREFRFYDTDHELVMGAITQDQANSILNVLTYCYDRNYNVIVNCHAGINRSGAVCEIGTIMGFEDTGRYRNANLLVKSLLLIGMGWSYER